MAAAVAEEYRAVIGEAAQLGEDGSEPPRPQSVSRLQRELQRLDRRDFFPPPEREQAHLLVRELAAQLEMAQP
jgi:hypothetical protein